MPMTGLVQRVTANDMLVRQQQSSNYKDNFSWGAIKVLHEYYEDVAEGMGQPIEFDFVAMVCEWTELTAEELLEETYREDGYLILEVKNLTEPYDGSVTWTYLVQTG